MSKLTRKNMKVFGQSSGLNQIEQFGSLAGGIPNYTTDVETIQALSAWLEGWFGGVVGSNLPAIQDLNGIIYVLAYQLAYLMQEGVAEWNSATTYYIGSIVNDGSGNLYVSIQDTNLNHAITDGAWWTSKDQPSKQIFTTSGSFVAPTGVTRVKVISEFYSPLNKTTDTDPHYFYSLTKGFALTDTNGNVWSWGGNSSGQLGLGNAANQALPQRVVALPIQARASIIAGNDGADANGAFIDNYGQMWTWGKNPDGQLADITTTVKSTPVMVFTNARFRKFFNVPFGSTSVTAIDIDGNAWSWGQNLSGDCGVNDVTPRSSPTLVVGGHIWKSGSISISSFVTAIDQNNAGYSWGENGNGELGVGDITDRSTPTLILGSHIWKQILPIQPFGNASVGLDTSGAAWGWGENSKGTLGNAANISVSSPVAVVGSHVFSTLIEGETINNNTAVGAIDSGGAAWMWGVNNFGQLGNNDNSGTSKSSPVAVVGGHLFTKLFTANDGRTTFALKANGELWGWGDNQSGGGLMGNNSATAAYSSPVLCASGMKFISIITQTTTVMGIDSNGQAWCWGANALGQCGTGETVVGAYSSPVMIKGAHPAMIEVAPTQIEFDVVPGQSYPIVLGYACTFNATPVSYMAKQLTVEYAN